MSAKSEKILRDFTQALTKPKGTTPYDTTAKVLRVENGIAWVHIAGGVDETPVKMTIDAKAGDEVQVRVSGGRAFIIGNVTAPPTDDATANVAKKRATNADMKATFAKQTAEEADVKATDAKEIAVEAGEAVERVAQHFWTDEVGAHVTQMPQDNFIADPDNGGGNTLITSEGLYVRDGTEILGSFTSAGAQIGRTDGARTIIEGGATTIYTEDSVPAFVVDTGAGTSIQLINSNEGVGGTDVLNTTFSKTFTVLNNVTNGEDFILRISGIRLSSGGVLMLPYFAGEVSFTKAMSGSTTKTGTAEAVDGSGETMSYSVTYSAPRTVTIKVTACSLSASKYRINAGLFYYAIVSDSRVDAPYGYSSGGAQIGSYMTLGNTATTNVTLTNSYQNLPLSTTVASNGNVFEYDSDNANGIVCKYAGIVLIVGQARLQGSFNANDIVYLQAYNATQAQGYAVRYKAWGTTPSTDVQLRAQPFVAHAGDVFNLRAYNSTAGRGTVPRDNIIVTAIYLSPILP